MSHLHTVEASRRRLLIEALASGVLGNALVSTTWAQGSKEAKGGKVEKLPTGTTVFRVTGGAFVNDQPMKADTPFPPNCVVHTALDSEAIFVVGTSAFLLRANSKLSLRGPANIAAGATGAGPGIIQVMSGKVLAVFGGGTRRLQTAAANIQISGTGVYLEARAEETYFCLCYGVAEVNATADPSAVERVVSRQHDRPLSIAAQRRSGSPTIRDAPFVNHTDQELALIETLVGRVPPFTHPKTIYEGQRIYPRR